MSQLDPRLAELIDKMPAFPASVARVMKLSQSMQCSPKDLVGVIEHDPVMTAKILKLVNSAYFGFGREITAVQQGVVILGINTVKNLAISIATLGMLPGQSLDGFDPEGFLRHSLEVAVRAKALALHLDVPKSEASNYFVAGLLHDVGALVTARYHDQTGNPPRMDDGGAINHSQLGAMVAENWQLPGSLVNAIRYHHAIEENPQPNSLADCIYAANQFTHALEQDPPAPAEFAVSVAQRLGGRDSIIAALADLDDDIEKARIFMQI